MDDLGGFPPIFGNTPMVMLRDYPFKKIVHEVLGFCFMSYFLMTGDGK